MREARAIVALLACCGASFVPAGAAGAAAWLPAAELASGRVSWEDAALTSRGEAIGVWRLYDGVSQYKIQASVRPPGGAFGKADDVIPFGAIVENLEISTDPDGNAILTWRKSHGGSDIRLYYSYRPAGGEFAPAKEVTGAGTHVALPTTEMDADGDAITAFLRAPGGDFHAAYVVRPAGGEFGEQQELTSYAAEDIDLGISGDGTAIASWTKTAGGPIEAARRPPAGSFGSIQTVSGAEVGGQRLAVGAGGRALLSWYSFAAPLPVAEASLAEPGGAFGTPKPISSPGTAASPPVPAVGAGNQAFLAWWQKAGEVFSLRFAAAPPGGALSPAAPLAGMGEFPREAEFADDGSLMLLADANDEAPTQVRAAARSAAGTFASPEPLSPQSESAETRSLDGDGRGNYLALYARDDGGGKYTLRARGYDGLPPELTAVSIPQRAKTGKPIDFSADATDLWGAPTVDWGFGDGSSATGASVSHTYRLTGGVRTVEVTATDAGGNSTTERRTILVKDVTPPVIRAARFVPSTFAVAGKGRRGRASGARRGSALRYRLSEPARVRVFLQRRSRGHRRGARCLPRRRAPRGKPCARYATVRKGQLRRSGRQGSNRLRFTGRVGRRALAAGRYRARLVATDTGGLRSRPAHAPFRIAPR